jgi:hypothetical protein
VVHCRAVDPDKLVCGCSVIPFPNAMSWIDPVPERNI